MCNDFIMQGVFMKKIVYIVGVVLLLACICSACDNKVHRENNNSDLDMQNDAPYFLDVETAKEELKSAIWGSQGWNIFFPNESNYIYAVFGSYMLRYNILSNEIDKAMILENTATDFLSQKLQFSLDGKYGTFSYVWNENHQHQSGNIYLIDFENSEITLLSDSEGNFKIENMVFDGDNHNLDILNYSIEYKSEEDQYIAYIKNHQSSGYEISALQGASLNGERPFVGIDSKTIGSLIPISGDGFNLGYYKFVLIDIEKDEIIQEYPINIR